MPTRNQKPDRNISIALHRTMLKIRLAELKVAEIYPSDKIQSPIHLSVGQEAVSAGVSLALSPADHLYGTYRGHGIYIGRGGDLKKLFAELYAKNTGCSRGKGGSMHLAAPETGLMGCSAIVASTIPVATGDALAAKIKKEDRVAVAFFGDGAVDEGVFFESMNFAVLKKLPIIYVCENNNYAVHSRVSDRHTQKELYRLGEGLGVQGCRFDGNNVSEVYSTMKEAVSRIKENPAPVLLEYMTYRIYEHVGIGKDHAEAYREPEKLRQAIQRDPLARSEEFLRKHFSISDLQFSEWEKEISEEIEDAVSFAEQSPFPAPECLYEDLFEEPK
ncbi:MAG TPA: thiamine pyrophosphate-dependent dehydrogenase E1 component subunit alpha [Candidatus Omnitrophota bacterium]|nr:thiamine pyrophosphate-dependent dehydrogenase E1 component subunit alpha [Candidatus Omnitrophota bacterium]